jgi:hypothetical protein
VQTTSPAIDPALGDNRLTWMLGAAAIGALILLAVAAYADPYTR